MDSLEKVMQRGTPSIRKYLSKLSQMIFKARERERAIYSTQVQIHLQKCCETGYFSDFLLKTGTQNHTGRGIHFRIAFLLFTKFSKFSLCCQISQKTTDGILQVMHPKHFFFSKIILSPKFQAL